MALRSEQRRRVKLRFRLLLQVPLRQRLPLESSPSFPSPMEPTSRFDGSFVGNAPSDLQLPEGEHTIAVKKTGFKDWERKMKVSGGSSVRLNAELEKLATP